MKEDIVIGRSVPAYRSAPDGAGRAPGIVLIHEIWGLVPHVRAVADRIAAEGYVVLAPDLLAGSGFDGAIDPALLKEMHDPATRDEAQKKLRTLFAPTQSPEFAKSALAKLRSCVDALAADAAVDGRIAVAGFCFGGTYSFALAAEDMRIAAAVPFYGRPPEPAAVPRIGCPVLAFYGEKDAGLMESLPSLESAMRDAGKSFERVVYPGAGHAFFNDTNPNTYNKEAAEDSWKRMLAFLRERFTR